MSYDCRCILASDCNRETVTSCKGPQSEKEKGESIDLRFNDDYVCCPEKDIIPSDPLECYDLPNHE